MTNQQFIYKPREIILDKRITPVEQDYLCFIGQLEKADGCTASNNYFARYFGVKRQTAQEVIGKLKTKNYIVCKEQKQGGKTVKRTIEIVDSSSRKLLLMNSDKVSRKRLPTKAVFDPSGLAGNSDKVSRKLPTHKTKVITNTTTTAHIPQKPFERFWSAYPKKQRRLDAQRAWQKLKPDTELAERIIKDVQRRSQTHDWQKENNKYVPMPTTYLNGQRWTDELPEPKRGDPDWLPDEQEAEMIMKDAGL